MPVFINKEELKETGKQLEKREVTSYGIAPPEGQGFSARSLNPLFKRAREDGIKVALASSAKEANSHYLQAGNQDRRSSGRGNVSR